MGKAITTLVLLCACSNPASAQRADFTQEGIEARIEKLRADVEQTLRSPIGSVEVKVCEPDVIADLLAAQIEHTRRNIEGGPRGDALHEAAREDARRYSQVVLGHVDPKSGVLHICPRNFDRMEERSKIWSGITSQGVLDVILIHEMAHVWQNRRFGLSSFVGTPKSLDELLGLVSVIEGHAQWVTRAVALRRGLDRSFRLLVAMQTELPPGVADESQRQVLDSANFIYAQGLRFWDAVIEELGEAAATKRIFAEPPRTTHMITRPCAYFDLTVRGFNLEKAARLLRRYVKEVSGKHALVVPAAEHTVLATLAQDGPATARAADDILGAVVVAAETATIAFVWCRDGNAARRLAEAVSAAVRERLKSMDKVTLDVREVAVDGRPVTYTRTSVTMEDHSLVIDQAIVVYKDVYIEVALHSAGLEQTRRVAARALQLVRGVRDPEPWDELEGEKETEAFAVALSHPDWGIRWRAVRNLARRFETVPEVETHLLRAVRDRAPSVRLEALRALGHARATALASDPDWEVRRAYCQLIADDKSLDKRDRVTRVQAYIADTSVETRLGAAKALLSMGVGRAIVFDINVPRRGKNKGILVRVTSDSAIGFDRIRTLYADVDARVRLAAVKLIPSVGSLEWGKLVLRAISDDDVAVRVEAITRLGEYSGLVEQSVRKLRELLQDGSLRIRRAAVAAVTELGESAKDAVPALIRLLDDDALAAEAAKALGEIGKAAEAARPRLIARMQADSMVVRLQAARTLEKLGSEPGPLVVVAADGLTHEDWWTRSDAAELLGELAEHAHEHIPKLIAALNDNNKWVRSDAADALGKFRTAARGALPTLRELLEDEEKLVRQRARKAISVIEEG